MRVLASLGMNDLRGVRRDSLLRFLVLLPWLSVVLARLIVPRMTGWLAADYGFDLLPYYPLLLSVLFVLQIPLLFGVVIGFLVLDERDDGVLTALRVTPLSLTSYLGYRVGAAALFAALYVLASLPLTGLGPLPSPVSLAAVALLAGLFAPVVALLLAAFAANKVEGLALMKGMGILMIGPMAAYFVDSDWQLLLGLLPSYWPAKAFWLSAAAAPWPYLLAGLLYHLLLLTLLVRRFQAKLYR